MILGGLEAKYTDHQKQYVSQHRFSQNSDRAEFFFALPRPGKYIALDCEMVGVGADGKESSLARVSIVNYHGAVLLDEIVKQRERVVDYRTKWSGIRPSDLVNGECYPSCLNVVIASPDRYQTYSQAVCGSTEAGRRFAERQDFSRTRRFQRPQGRPAHNKPVILVSLRYSSCRHCCCRIHFPRHEIPNSLRTNTN